MSQQQLERWFFWFNRHFFFNRGIVYNLGLFPPPQKYFLKMVIIWTWTTIKRKFIANECSIYMQMTISISQNQYFWGKENDSFSPKIVVEKLVFHAW